VHFLEGEDTDRAGLLLYSRIVGPNADALEGVRSQTSSVIAPSAIAERARRMPTAPVVAPPSTLSMWSTRARV